MIQSYQSQSTIKPDEGASKELILTPNIIDGDGFYDELLLAHEGMSKEDSDAFNARLILLLCNHIGDRHIITQALKAAAQARSAAQL